MTDINEKTGIAAVPGQPGERDALTEQVQEVLERLQPYLKAGLLYQHEHLRRLVFPFQETTGYLALGYLVFSGTQRNPCARILTGEDSVEGILQHYQQEGYTLAGSLTLQEAMDGGPVQPKDLYPIDRDILRELCLRLQFSRVATSSLQQDIPWS